MFTMTEGTITTVAMTQVKRTSPVMTIGTLTTIRTITTANKPVLRAALQGGVGESQESSVLSGSDRLYVLIFGALGEGDGAGEGQGRSGVPPKIASTSARLRVQSP
jgi:hypothetical protein